MNVAAGKAFGPGPGGHILPGRVEVLGVPYRVQRAWPRPDGSEVFEARDHFGRIRAGRWSEGRASLLGFADDPRLPGLAAAWTAAGSPDPDVPAGTELLVHRWGRRAVLRVQAPEATVFLKILRPGRATELAGTSRQLAGLARQAGLNAPDVLGVEGSAVVFAALSGTQVAELGGQPRWRQAWAAWAAAWPRLATTPAPADAVLPVHDAEREAAQVRTWVGRLCSHNPLGLGASRLEAAESRLAQVAARLTATARSPLVTAHRDLHDKQLLFDAGTGDLGILDFDTAARAEAELDLGNLLAHLDLRHDQGRITGPDRRAARDLVLSTAAAMEADGGRLGIYVEAARLRLACVYAFRPAWRALAAEWL